MPLFEKYKHLKIDLRAVQAEFIAMIIFVYVGCGAAVFLSSPQGFNWSSNPRNFLPQIYTPSFGTSTALTFGFTITVLAYSIGHISGGHINSAVSWGLFCANKLNIGQLLCNHFAQFTGSIVGAGLLYLTVPYASQTTLGSNSISGGASLGNALVGEVFMTFVLVFVVLMTTSDEAKSSVGKLAPIPIGMAVFAAHCVLIPLDGCSINPSRSFGPALLSGTFESFWIFIVGPYLGATLGALAYWSFQWGVKTEKPAGAPRIARSPSADQLLEGQIANSNTTR